MWIDKVNLITIGFLFTYTKTVFGDGFQSTLGKIKPQSDADAQANAAWNLISRIIPNDAYRFVITVDAGIGPEGKDTFQIQNLPNNSLHIRGTSGVAVATGFNYYLKYYCSSHISWEISQISIPDTLPTVNLTQTSNDRFRYYQNACTPSYSFTWWNWKQWEKHIDWMALNSFNLVLAFTGEEAIWNRVYKTLNLTQSDIDEHFAGPAFLAWGRMGNIRGWGGPLSEAWHERSLTLQKQILNRMRELGIIPVLPAFAGHVPRAFKRLYPNSKMVELATWNKFNETYCCPLLLDPTEQLFKTVGNMFLQELISEFGTDHVYSCDTFNEMEPFTTNLTYLSAIGKSTYSAMTDVDSDAIWLLQGWMFHFEMSYWNEQVAETYLRSIPLGKMIVLDLQSEQFPQYSRLKSYFGQPYIWCMLHNFGGTLGMYGSADIINTRPFDARKQKGSTMIGTGITPEGINQNYIVYDLMTEMSWRKDPTKLPDWFKNYTTRRYGQYDANANTAWQILATSLYNFDGLELIRGKYAINRSPSTTIKSWYWYNICDLYESWFYFLKASNSLQNSLGYQHDLVDLTRQVLQVVGDQLYKQIVHEFKEKQVNIFQNSVKQFLTLFDDLEEILATNEAFLLGKWLRSAKEAATNDKDKSLFEYNARNQITLWGPNGEIKDYASKQWSGMVSKFFRPRWELFLRHMNSSLADNTPFKESIVRNTVFKQVEQPFTFDTSDFPDQPRGDSVEVARNIYDRWWPNIHCSGPRRNVHHRPEETTPYNDHVTVIMVD